MLGFNGKLIGLGWVPGFQVLQNRILLLLCTSDSERVGGIGRGRCEGYTCVSTMCRGFDSGDGQKCLDIEKVFLEEYNISILHAFLDGGYFCAKNQTDSQIVRLP